MSKHYPKVGDLWKNTDKQLHYLLLEEYTNSLHYDFLFLILETGKYDKASAMHFIDYCEKVH